MFDILGVGDLLIDLIGQEASVIVLGLNRDFSSETSADSIERDIWQSEEIRETEKHQLVKSRRGQGLFRSRLEKVEVGCRVTGTTLGNHLVASHIKPWAKSTNVEKLDGNNVLLLAPHIDHLFDRGFITSSDDGNIIVSSELSESIPLEWGISSVNVGKFSDEQKKYLSYHRDVVFRS